MGISKKAVKNTLRQNALTIATLSGVLIGIILGVCLRQREEPWSAREKMYVQFLGKIFLRMLKCIILPLVIPSLIVAVGTLDLGLSGRLGARAIVYYLSTTICAVIMGIVLCHWVIRPGVGNECKPNVLANDGNNVTSCKLDDKPNDRNVTTADTLMDLIRNVFPPNLIEACISQTSTVLMYPDTKEMMEKITDMEDCETVEDCKTEWKFKTTMGGSMNILGLIAFSLAFGIAIAMSGEDGKPVLNFLTSFVEIIMKITNWIIHLAPVGVCFLVAGEVIGMKDVAENFGKLGWFFATVVLGLSIHGLLLLPILYSAITRSLPFHFIKNMSRALATAFGTSSSSATLPVTIDCLENENKIDSRVSRFVLPIGATINMDGTALYEAVSALFIAQLRGIELTGGQVVTVSITATAASIGAAGIPSAGLVTMVMVLQTVGLPTSDIGLLLTLDWLLDRFRTAINVLGDAIGAGIVYHLSKEQLEEMDVNGIESVPEQNGTAIKENGKTNPAYDEKF